MDRRRFITTTSVLVASSTLLPRAFAQDASVPAAITLGAAGHTMPTDFTGLSYESAQLSNPEFFSASNTALVEQFRQLSPNGVLRLGGSLSDFTFFKGAEAPPLGPAEEAAIVHAKTYFEWILTDPVARNARRSLITAVALRNLRGFLDVTGWRALYGLNFGSGSPERAAIEAAAVQQILGPRLIAFQLGNECDFFADSRRPKPWDFAHYWADYQRFVTAIRQRSPKAPMAGPDVAVRTDWVADYAADVHGDAVLLSKHHYVMGPAEDPAMNAQRLLGPDADLAKQTPLLMQAAHSSGIPCRMTEINTCFHGGKPGVSDAYASALWAAGAMLQLASDGYSGINLHGGGDGIYSPIVGDRASGFSARPLCYGMQFAERFAGSTFLQTNLGYPGNADAYVTQRDSEWLLAVLNRGPQTLQVSLTQTPLAQKRCTGIETLSAPALDSKTGVAFTHSSFPHRHKKVATIEVAPYSAQLLHFA